MADRELSIKRHPDGSIDFDAYRADAVRRRKAARLCFLREMALPFFRNLPATLAPPQSVRRRSIDGEASVA